MWKLEAVQVLWKRKHFGRKKLEANSEAFNFLRSRKR